MRTDRFQSIGLDLDNTLINRHGAVRQWALDLIQRYPSIVEEQEPNSLVKAILVADDHGYCPRTDFCNWISNRFPRLEMSQGEVWQDFCHHLPRFICPDQKITAMIGSLCDGFDLYVVSNGSAARQREKLACAGLTEFFKHIVISDEVGTTKPDPSIFLTAFEELTGGPADSIFVGDDPVCDIMGAARVGMKTCWVSMGRAFPGDLPEPDWSIHSIDQLPEIFQ